MGPTNEHENDDFKLRLDDINVYEEEEIFSVDIHAPTLSDIGDDDDEEDSSFAKKLLLSPRWHDIKNEPIREFKQLTAKEYYAKQKEILNPISYSTNIHIHKQKHSQQEQQTSDDHKHPFEIFLRDLDEYHDQQSAFDDDDEDNEFA